MCTFKDVFIQRVLVVCLSTFRRVVGMVLGRLSKHIAGVCMSCLDECIVIVFGSGHSIVV